MSMVAVWITMTPLWLLSRLTDPGRRFFMLA